MIQAVLNTLFIEELQHEVMAHPVMGHPFWDRFRKGGLSRQQLQRFTLHYYQHVKKTRLYAAAVLSRTPIEGIQAAIASVLWDEYGEGNLKKVHPEQFRRLLRALGLTENQWDHVEELSELKIYQDVHYRLCTEYPFWAGLGVVGMAMELPIPKLYDHLIEGFLKSGVREKDLEFFVEHGPMDIHHAHLLIDAMSPHLGDLPDRKAFREGIIRSLDARYILMDGMLKLIWA